MFFTEKHKLKIVMLEEEVSFLRRRLDIQTHYVYNLKDRLKLLETAAHGLKKDLTPRAKPGRKVKVQP